MLVWDAHAGLDPAARDLDRLVDWQAAGFNFVSVNVGYDVMPWHDAIRVVAAYRTALQKLADRYLLIERHSDLAEAMRTGRVAVSFDLEGLNALAGDVRLLEVYHALGVRQMLFAYNMNNPFAGGCHDEDQGLTTLGEQALAEMNRLGILVDCSHVGHRSSLEIMERSTRPVVFSHSNCAKLQPHGRNISDEEIRACAATGGVVGITGINLFLGLQSLDPVDAVVRHVAHVAKLVGTRHVGLGLDSVPPSQFGNFQAVVEGTGSYWPAEEYREPLSAVQPERISDIGEALGTAGFGADDIALVLGANFSRVASEVWL
jgi:membrane dipeptidase